MALRWNHSFLPYLLLIFVASLMLQVRVGADDHDDGPFMHGKRAKGYQVVYLENQNFQDFYVDCKGYQNHDLDRPFFIASGYARTNAKFTMKFDRIKSWKHFEVYCTYYGADGCSAENVRVFSAPAGDDLYHCSRDSTLLRGCGYRFRADGKVIKLVGGKDDEYIGQIPMKKNYKKTCFWHWCFRPVWGEDIIGSVQCCDGRCN